MSLFDLTSILGGGQPQGRTRLQLWYFTHFSILNVPIHFLQFITWSIVIAAWFATIIQGQWWFISHSIYLLDLAIIVFLWLGNMMIIEKLWTGVAELSQDCQFSAPASTHTCTRTHTCTYVHIQKHRDQREMKEGLFEKESERTSIFPNMICWLDESTSVLCCLLRKNWLNLAHLFHKQQKKNIRRCPCSYLWWGIMFLQL